MYHTADDAKRKVRGSEPSDVVLRGDTFPGRRKSSEDSGPLAVCSAWSEPQRQCSPHSTHQSEDDRGDRGTCLCPPEGGEEPTESVRCLAHRFDWLTIAWRVTLGCDARDALRRAAPIAQRIGSAELVLPGVDPADPRSQCVAQVKPQKGQRVVFENSDLRGYLVEDVAGEEPGWSLEITARAVYLALHDPSDVLEELRTWAKAFGQVHEERVRRADMAADFVHWPIREEDAHAIVRLPRATLTSWSERRHRDAKWDKTYSNSDDEVTGFVLCPGNALMLRIYNKLEELRVHRGPETEEKEQIERAIWKEADWSGEPITRVEFQIRGVAADELFGRSADRLIEEAPAIWGYCTRTWTRMVELDRTRRRRSTLDPRWEAARSVVWGPPQPPAVRVRRRGFSNAIQSVTCAMTALAQSELIPEEGLDRDDHLTTLARQSEEHAQAVLGTLIDQIHHEVAALAADALRWKHDGSTKDAVDFVIQRLRSAQARAWRAKREEDENGRDGQRPLDERVEGSNSGRVGVDDDALPRDQDEPIRATPRRDYRSDRGSREMDVGFKIKRWLPGVSAAPRPGGDAPPEDGTDPERTD